MRIVRVKHTIRLWDGLTIGDIIFELKKVPSNLKLELEEAEDGDVLLNFTEEKFAGDYIPPVEP